MDILQFLTVTVEGKDDVMFLPTQGRSKEEGTPTSFRFAFSLIDLDFS